MKRQNKAKKIDRGMTETSFCFILRLSFRDLHEDFYLNVFFIIQNELDKEVKIVKEQEELYQ